MPSNLPDDDPWFRRERERVGRCIQQTRLHHNLTQERVYNAIPLNRAYYQDIEAGRANPTLDTLNGIARAIGVSLSDLVRDPPPVQENSGGPRGRPPRGT